MLATLLTAAAMLSATMATPLQLRQTSTSIYTLHDLTRVCSTSPYGPNCNYDVTLIERNNTGTFSFPCYYSIGAGDIVGDEYTNIECYIPDPQANSPKLLFSQSYFASSPISYYGIKVVDTSDHVFGEFVRAADFVFEAAEFEGTATVASTGPGSTAVIEPDHTATAYNTWYPTAKKA